MKRPKILEEVEGDMLEAVIRLEKENKIERPEAAGYYNSKADTHSEEGRSRSRNHKGTRDKGPLFWGTGWYLFALVWKDDS